MKNWDRVRKSLKQRFTEMNVTSCEDCGSTFALSFSHRYKRKDIHDDLELSTVVLLCGDHHNAIENAVNKIEYHDNLIASRGFRATLGA